MFSPATAKRGQGTLAFSLVVLAVAVFSPFASGASEPEPSSGVSMLSEDRVRADLNTFLSAGVSLDDREIDVEIEIPPLSTFSVDASGYEGEWSTELTTKSRTPYKGRVPVNVSLFAGEELVHQGIISPYLRVSKQVVVAQHDLSRGDILSADDLTMASKDEARVPRDVIVDPERAIGLRMRRPLRKGAAFRSGQIESVPLVERGDRVMLILEAGGLQLQATARAQEKGAVGEWIRVLNLDSKREILGRVDAEGKVRVAY